jgi:hypothetical protein
VPGINCAAINFDRNATARNGTGHSTTLPNTYTYTDSYPNGDCAANVDTGADPWRHAVALARRI